MSKLGQEWGLSNYSDRILTGDYSHSLKVRIAELVAAFEVFDLTVIPGIPYISAWHHGDNIIWYEFAGREFIQLFNCSTRGLADVFRGAVVDHRVSVGLVAASQLQTLSEESVIETADHRLYMAKR